MENNKNNKRMKRGAMVKLDRVLITVYRDPTPRIRYVYDYDTWRGSYVQDLWKTQQIYEVTYI